MQTAHELTTELIARAKNLKEFTVFRKIDTQLIFKGAIPFDVYHVAGEPVEFTVPALTQEEAEQQVNDWLSGLEDSE